MSVKQKKILIVATVWNFFVFEKNDIKILREAGHEVHCATNFNIKTSRKLEIDIIKHQVDFARSPFSIENIKAYKQLKELIDTEQFDLVHCHTPVGGILARLVARKYRKSGTKVIYTSHGFHFYKGGAKKSWLMYYPIEWLCSKWTDILITINDEDYSLAKTRFHAKSVIRIPGIGIDLKRFRLKEFDRVAYRKSINISDDDIMVFSVGELNSNKNHSLIMQAIAKQNDSRIHYFIAGEGGLSEQYKKLAMELGIEERVHLLGFRTDIPELDHAADIFAFPTIREGLGLSGIEALACGTPVIGMNTRGIREYVINDVTGYLFENDVDSCVESIKKILGLTEKERARMCLNCKKTSEKYSREKTEMIMRRVYSEL